MNAYAAHSDAIVERFLKAYSHSELSGLSPGPDWRL
jgi:hypothetical protein